MSQLNSNDDISLSIFDIDEVLKDDQLFSNTDTSDELPDEIKNILQQWKLNEQSNITLRGNNNATKYIDTKTFTRPKKKIVQHMDTTGSSLAENESPAPINLRIGGLVKSMQGSFLSEVTPPPNMESSLITSIDFEDLNFLQQENDYGYNLDDCVLNETFVPGNLSNIKNNINNTFNMNSLNDTIIVSSPNNKKMETFINNENILNTTFPTVPSSKILEKPVYHNQTFEKLPEEKLNNHTFELEFEDINTENIVESPKMINNNSGSDEEITKKIISRRSLENITPIRGNNNYKELNSEIDMQSTPLNNTFLKNHSTLTPTKSMSNNSRRHARKIINDDLNSDDFEKAQNRYNAQTQEEERRSLVNFEEFEKSISLLEKDGSTEKEFDDILNSFGNSESKIKNERMRQNLDNIKKRHSLLNLEKQKEDALRKSIEVNIDSNRLVESIGKSMNSSSGSERLLNRRSRLFDEFNAENETLQNSTDLNNIEEKSYEKQEKQGRDRDRFKTIKIIRPPQDQPLNLPDADAYKSTNDECVEASIPPKISYENFTQRETNSPNSKHVTNDTVFKTPLETDIVQPKKRTLARPRYFGSKPSLLMQPLKSSSADDLLDRNICDDHHIQHAQNDKTNENSKNLKTLKSPMGVKAKSFHNLAGQNTMLYNYNTNRNGFSRLNQVKPVSKLSIPASRLGTNNARENESKMQIQSNLRLPRGNSLVRPTSSAKQSSDAIYNRNEIKSGVNLRSNFNGATKNINMVRPNSAYYSYNTKIIESDSESERFSPNSLSSSSASSRGSNLHELEQNKQIINIVEKVPEKPIEISRLKKPSGLRPPSNLREPTARSGLPRPTGIPRR